MFVCQLVKHSFIKQCFLRCGVSEVKGQVILPAVGLLRFGQRVVEEWVSFIRVVLQVQIQVQMRPPVVGHLAVSRDLLLEVSWTQRRHALRVLNMTDSSFSFSSDTGPVPGWKEGLVQTVVNIVRNTDYRGKHGVSCWCVAAFSCTTFRRVNTDLHDCSWSLNSRWLVVCLHVHTTCGHAGSGYSQLFHDELMWAGMNSMSSSELISL